MICAGVLAGCPISDLVLLSFVSCAVKVPPAINQFSQTLDKSQATELFKLMAAYRPESHKEKTARLQKEGEAKAAGKSVASVKPPPVLKFGLHHVTTLVEQKKAKLVVIASDVAPLELVLWLPSLCRKMGVPYVIVNNKGRLGALVHQTSAAALAIVDVNKEHDAKLSMLVEVAKAKFNDNKDALKKWGGGKMGLRTENKLAKRAAQVALEEAKKAKMIAA